MNITSRQERALLRRNDIIMIDKATANVDMPQTCSESVLASLNALYSVLNKGGQSPPAARFWAHFDILFHTMTRNRTQSHTIAHNRTQSQANKYPFELLTLILQSFFSQRQQLSTDTILFFVRYSIVSRLCNILFS